MTRALPSFMGLFLGPRTDVPAEPPLIGPVYVCILFASMIFICMTLVILHIQTNDLIDYLTSSDHNFIYIHDQIKTTTHRIQ